MLSGLYGKNGAMNSLTSDLQNQVGQGWSLQPQDQTMYGQAAGQIARNYGQQGNQAANNLAQRGLSNSGAAGAQFSGLAGNQNEQLANAQTQIMQQRFQNTMQQANMANQMGLGAQQAINQQNSRQMGGEAQQQQGLFQAAGIQNQTNQAANSGNVAAGEFNYSTAAPNVFDSAYGGVNGFVGAAGKGFGQKFSGSGSDSKVSTSTAAVAS
jgi:hypothetical protein